MRPRTLAGLTALLAAGCRQAPAPPSPAASARTQPTEPAQAASSRPPAPAQSHAAAQALGRAPAAITRSLDSSTAFDLAVHPSGVTLAWAQRRETRAHIVARSYDSSGKPSGGAFTLLGEAPSGQVSDLHFAWLERSPVAAWVERAGDAAKLRAVLANDPRAPEAFDLGPAWLPSTPERGNVALSVDDRRAVVFARGAAEPCARGGDAPCHGFAFHHVPPDGGQRERVALEVPVPCARHSALLAMTRPRWHYAVCTQAAGRPGLTVFDIQPDPQYAAASQILEGCEPLGILTIDGDPSIVANCDGRRTIAHLRSEDGPVPVEPASPVDPTCTNGKLWLRVGAHMHAFSTPQRGLELLLPPHLAPAGARAAWSGNALLVASTLGSELHWRRYVCDGEAMVAATP